MEDRTRGIDVAMLDRELAFLFYGKPEAYDHFVASLDVMPPAARLAAHVRSADAVTMLQRLRQSVS